MDIAGKIVLDPKFCECMVKLISGICIDCVYEHMGPCCFSLFQLGCCLEIDNCCVSMFKYLTCFCNCSLPLQNCLNRSGGLAFRGLVCCICFWPECCLKTIGYRKGSIKQDNLSNPIISNYSPVPNPVNISEAITEPLVPEADVVQATEHIPNHGEIYGIMPMRNY